MAKAGASLETDRPIFGGRGFWGSIKSKKARPAERFRGRFGGGFGGRIKTQKSEAGGEIQGSAVWSKAGRLSSD